MDPRPPDQWIRVLRDELQRFRKELKHEIVEEMDLILDKKLSGAMARLIKWEIPQVLLPKILERFLKPLVEEWMHLQGIVRDKGAIPQIKEDPNSGTTINARRHPGDQRKPDAGIEASDRNSS